MSTAHSPSTLIRMKSSPEFRRAVDQRKVVGVYRYEGGTPETLAFLPGEIDSYVKAMLGKLFLFLETRNYEFLVDVANYAELVTLYDNHSRGHFTPVDQGDPEAMAAKRYSEFVGSTVYTLLQNFRIPLRQGLPVLELARNG